MDFKSIEYNGTTYLLVRGNWLEQDTYIMPSESVIRNLTKIFYENMDSSSLTNDELLEKIKEIKDNKSYGKALEFTCDLLNRCGFSDSDIMVSEENVKMVKTCLPILSSIYRSMNKSYESIRIFDKIKALGQTRLFTPAFLTSVSAAYADLKEYESAVKIIASAFKMDKMIKGASVEISNVYSRLRDEIEKNVGMDFENFVAYIKTKSEDNIEKKERPKYEEWAYYMRESFKDRGLKFDEFLTSYAYYILQPEIEDRLETFRKNGASEEELDEERKKILSETYDVSYCTLKEINAGGN